MEIKKSLSADLEGKKGTGLLMGFVLALSAMFVAFEWTQHDKKVIETEPVFTVAIEEDMIPITQQPEVVAPPRLQLRKSLKSSISWTMKRIWWRRKWKLPRK